MYFLNLRVKGLTHISAHSTHKNLQSVAKLMTHCKIWNLLDERRTTAKENTVCQIPPPLPINVDHSFRHYGHFVSGQHCTGGRGDVKPRFGILENSPKTVKCVINFATDCSCTQQNHGRDAYSVRKKRDSFSTHLELHTRQTIT